LVPAQIHGCDQRGGVYEVNELDRELCTRAIASLKRALPGDGPGTVLSHQDAPAFHKHGQRSPGYLTWCCERSRVCVRSAPFLNRHMASRLRHVADRERKRSDGLRSTLVG
jgi:hypothetical protein